MGKLSAKINERINYGKQILELALNAIDERLKAINEVPRETEVPKQFSEVPGLRSPRISPFPACQM